MITINFSSSTIYVEPDGDPSKLALVETLETTGSASRVEYHHTDENDLPVAEALFEEVRARSSGGRVSREYSLREGGRYVITSGCRENLSSRTFNLHMESTGPGRVELTVLPGSARSTWVVGDNLTHYVEGDTARFVIEIEDVVAVENAGTTEYKRPTAWERIMADGGDDSV